MFKSALACLALAAGLATPVTASPDTTLGVGDRAPLLENVEWLQGDPIPAWESGRIYVIDFWATWCGPCRSSIPHINDLSKELADRVTFIGAAIWPKPNMVPTADFVADQGASMAYPIAEATDKQVAEQFMDASGSNGIPTCMVIDGEGTVAWIGHPMGGLDEVLDEVVAGTWDMDAEIERRAAERALEAKLQPHMEGLSKAMQAKDWETVATHASAMAALDPRYAGYRTYEYRAMLSLERNEDAQRVGREMVKGAQDIGSAGFLNGLAWEIVGPDSELTEEQLDLELAEMAAARANELTGGKDPSILDTLARVMFVKGDVAQAVEIQRKAIELADGPQRAQLEETLAEYEAARA